MTAERFGKKNFKCKLCLGDAKEVLMEFPPNIFHCSVTSPPYWDQRDYSVAGQLGQEETPDEYISNLVSICEGVKRVLRDDGTFWVNIGDGYCKQSIPKLGLKQKDLIGIPWMFAFAMRQAGWYLRNEIIWAKTNPMPDSAKDRLAKSHEHLFLFSKMPQYFFDWFAISEPQEEISIKRAMSKNKVDKRKDANSSQYAISGANQDKTYQKLRERIDAGEDIVRSKRDVWTLSTADSSFQHFAMYPEHLVDPCIMAGSSLQCCSKCKTPHVRLDRKNEFVADCQCNADVQECIVLDPFNGSGTTGRVCSHRYRKYVGIDISLDYIKASRDLFVKNDQYYKEIDTIQEIIE